MNIEIKVKEKDYVLGFNKTDIALIPKIFQNKLIVNDFFSNIKPNVILWKREFIFEDKFEIENFDFVMEVKTNFKPDITMIPSVMYNDNDWGVGTFPKGYFINNTPWTFGFHRTSIPGATFSSNKDFSLSMFSTNNASELPFSCSLYPEGDVFIHKIIIPEQEKPQSYLQRKFDSQGYRDTLKDTIFTSENHKISMESIIVIDKVRPNEFYASGLLKFAWDRFYRKTNPIYSPQEVWNLGIKFAKNHLWVNKKKYHGFSIGIMKNPITKRLIQRPLASYEIGWCGQNASLAVSCIYDYYLNKNEDSLEKGIQCLDTWANNAPLPNGLFRVQFDPILRKRNPNKEIYDTCNLGDVIFQFLNAYELCNKIGKEKPKYRDVALNLCDFFLKNQFSTGSYGKAWNGRGKCINHDGSIGMFIVPGMLKAFKITKNEYYLESAIRAYNFYMSEFKEKGCTTAGALDSYCIDKESAYPFVQSALILYEITTDTQYLHDAEYSSWYLMTWLFHHSIPFPKNSTLGRLDYDTYGGTSVSVAHHHLDPWGARFFLIWIQLSGLLNEPKWIQRAKIAWNQSLFGISTGEFKSHGITWPEGAQNEGSFHTRFGSRYDVSLWFVAWPTAFRLEMLRNIKDWNIFK